MINKVEICGVNPSKLPVLSNEDLIKIKNGEMVEILIEVDFIHFYFM